MKQEIVGLLALVGMVSAAAVHATSQTPSVLESPARAELQSRIAQSVVAQDEEICWVAPEWRSEDR
jgi:hypothetical protein